MDLGLVAGMWPARVPHALAGAADPATAPGASRDAAVCSAQLPPAITAHEAVIPGAGSVFIASIDVPLFTLCARMAWRKVKP